VRVGVVGLGFGAAVHVPALLRIEGVEVVALAGSDAHRAQQAADAAGIPLGCGSVDELLDQRLDAVTIAVPPDRQAHVAAAVLAAGLPVLAEKPLATNVREAEELVELAKSLTTAVDFEFAELQTFRTLREALAEGTYGGVRSVEVTWLTRPHPGRARPGWKGEPGRGGVLPLLGSHVLYLLEWLLGPVEAVSAEAIETRLTLTCRVGGVPVGVTLDNGSAEQRHEWRVEFGQETLTASNTGLDAVQGFRLLAASGSMLASEPADLHPDGRVAAVAHLATRFVAAAAEGRSLQPDFGDGLRVQRVMAEIESLQAVTR
jgi:predicted dehydrogenase